MKKNRMITLALAVLLLASMLAGCGGASKGSGEARTFLSEAAQDAAPAAMNTAAMDTGAGLARSAEEGATLQVPENRKWIVTVYLNAETEDLDTLTAALNEQISNLNGYVEDQHINNGSAYSSRRYRSASLTIRIPAEDVDTFTQQVSGIANVVSQEKNLQDVTLSYTTTENRVKALQTEESRLLELMAQADNMSDLLEIEGRLTDVRYELENYGSQLKLFDNQIDYATIYLSIDEVQEYTPVQDPTTWERIRDGFKSSLKGVAEGAVDIAVFVLANLPYLVIYAALAVVVILFIRRCRLRRKTKKTAPPKENEESK